MDTLSDPQKREIYDSYGNDAVNQMGENGGGNPFGRSPFQHHFSRGGDISPEELFNMFFNGPGGHPFKQQFNRRQQQQYQQQQHNRQQNQQQSAQGLLQQFMLPILLAILFLFSMNSGEEPLPYSFSRSGSHIISKITSKFEVPYFVSDKFSLNYHENSLQLKRLEKAIESDYFDFLQKKCSQEKGRIKMQKFRETFTKSKSSTASSKQEEYCQLKEEYYNKLKKDRELQRQQYSYIF